MILRLVASGDREKPLLVRFLDDSGDTTAPPLAVPRTFFGSSYWRREIEKIVGSSLTKETFAELEAQASTLLAPAEKKAQPQFPTGADLFPGGGVDTARKLAWTPIGGSRYAFAFNGVRGIANPEDNDGKPIIRIGEYVITRPLIETSEFLKPGLDWWESWAKDTQPAPNGRELFLELVQACGVFGDLSSCDKIAEAVVAGTSWAEPWLPVFPRLDLAGPPGGGKTANLETVCMLSRGGIIGSDVSAAAFAWTQLNERAAWFIDEIDAIAGKNKKHEEDDDPLTQLARQGYRRGASYKRVNPDNQSVTHVPLAGPLAYTRVEEVDSMLGSRSLSAELQPSDDQRLPVINSPVVKASALLSLKRRFWAWFMAQADSGRPTVDETRSVEFSVDLSKPADEIRKTLFEFATAGFTAEELAFLRKFRGRSEELALNLVNCGRVFGLKASDYDVLGEALTIAQARVNEPEGVPGLVLDILRTRFDAGTETVMQKVVFDDLFDKQGVRIGAKGMRGVLRKAGIPAEAIIRGKGGRLIRLTPALKKWLYPEKSVENAENAGNARNIEGGLADTPLPSPIKGEGVPKEAPPIVTGINDNADISDTVSFASGQQQLVKASAVSFASNVPKPNNWQFVQANLESADPSTTYSGRELDELALSNGFGLSDWRALLARMVSQGVFLQPRPDYYRYQGNATHGGAINF